MSVHIFFIFRAKRNESHICILTSEPKWTNGVRGEIPLDILFLFLFFSVFFFFFLKMPRRLSRTPCTSCGETPCDVKLANIPFCRACVEKSLDEKLCQICEYPCGGALRCDICKDKKRCKMCTDWGIIIVDGICEDCHQSRRCRVCKDDLLDGHYVVYNFVRHCPDCFQKFLNKQQ